MASAEAFDQSFEADYSGELSAISADLLAAPHAGTDHFKTAASVAGVLVEMAGVRFSLQTPAEVQQSLTRIIGCDCIYAANCNQFVARSALRT